MRNTLKTRYDKKTYSFGFQNEFHNFFHSSCNLDKDECLDEPCKNGGTCEQDLQVPGNYTCLCSDEFIGDHCDEVKIKTCDNFPCQNGAICTNDPGKKIVI